MQHSLIPPGLTPRRTPTQSLAREVQEHLKKIHFLAGKREVDKYLRDFIVC